MANPAPKKPAKRSRSELGRNHLIEKISKKHGLTKQKSREVIKGLFEEIASGISRGKPYEILGYGKFYISSRKARQGRNPRTGEEVPITARRVVTFKPGQKLRAQIDNA